MKIEYKEGGTLIGKALAHARSNILIPSNGDRADVQNVIMVLTDGDSSDEIKQEAEAIRAAVGFYVQGKHMAAVYSTAAYKSVHTVKVCCVTGT